MGSTRIGAGLVRVPSLSDHGAMTSQPARRSPYAMGSFPNMLRSLLVLGFIVAAFVALVPRIEKVDRPAVDAVGKARQVVEQQGWPVVLPEGLGADWVPTVATLAAGTEEVATFTTVWSTSAGQDIALKQAVEVTPGWLARSVNDGVKEGTVSVGGATWERYAVPDRAQISYVLSGAGDGAVTVVATGVVSDEDLTRFVGSLEPVEPTS